MRQDQREFTGRHMLFLMLGFFGVIIGVNVTMAVMASESWTGLVVKNSYVASQEFNERSAEGRAQAALGWKGELEIAPQGIRYRLRDASGSTIPLDSVTIFMHRPASAADDRHMTLGPVEGGAFAAEAGTLADGAWVVEIAAEAGLAHPYRDIHRIMLTDGALK